MSLKIIPGTNRNFLELLQLQIALQDNLGTAELFKQFHENQPDPMSHFVPVAEESRQYLLQNYGRQMLKMISNQELSKLEKEFQGIQDRVNNVDAIQKEQYRSIIETLGNKFKNLKTTVEFFKTQFVDMIKNSPSFFVADNGILLGTDALNAGGMIRECRCTELMSRKGRRVFSDQLVNSIKTKWPDKKELAITSIGAGGACFHEFEIHALLAEKGIKVNWVIVDPVLFEARIEQFKMLAQWLTPEICVSSVERTAAAYFDGFATLPNPILPDVFLFIDAEPLTQFDISNYKTKINHPCLFADYNKFKIGNTDPLKAINIFEVNNQ